MSNRRKPRRRFKLNRVITEQALQKIDLPKSDKVVLKTVPAKADGEEIGTCVIYDDGTMDIITFEGISMKARADIKTFQEFMMGEDDGATEQV